MIAWLLPNTTGAGRNRRKTLGRRAANVHFEDRIEDGRILFDYVMRPGVVRKSNAIELMRPRGAGDLTAGGDSRAGPRVRLRAGRRGARRTGRRARLVSRVGRRRIRRRDALSDRPPRRWCATIRAACWPRRAPSLRGQALQHAWPLLDAVRRSRASLDLALRLGRGLSQRASPRPGAARRYLARARRRRLRIAGSASIPRRCWSVPTPARPGWDGSAGTRASSTSGAARGFSWENCWSRSISTPGCAAARTAAGPAAAASRPAPPRRSCRAPLGYTLDSRLCISYFTIELRGAIPEAHRAGMGRHVFGCDICQDVCPWNRRAPVTGRAGFAAARSSRRRWKSWPPSRKTEFRALFQGTPVIRARYSGFLRNVAIAMGNSGLEKFRAPLEDLARSDRSASVAEHANDAALETLKIEMCGFSLWSCCRGASGWPGALVNEGYDRFYNLEYDEAIADFERAVAQSTPIFPISTTTWPKPWSSARCTATARSKARWSRATTRSCAGPN